MRGSCLCSLNDFVVGRVGSAVTDVFTYRTGEEVRVLKHHCDIFSQHVAFDFSDIDSVDGDGAFVYVVKTVYQVCDRRFACAGGADKCYLLTRLCVKRYVLENDFVGNVAEGHILEFDMTGHMRHINCVGVVGGLGLRVHDREYSFGTGKCGEYRRDLLGQLVYRHTEARGIVHEYRQTADVKFAESAQHAADTRREGVAYLAHVAHYGSHDTAEKLCVHLLGAQVLIKLLEFLFAGLLMVEHLDYLLTRDGLFDISVDGAECRLLC